MNARPADRVFVALCIVVGIWSSSPLAAGFGVAARISGHSSKWPHVGALETTARASHWLLDDGLSGQDQTAALSAAVELHAKVGFWLPVERAPAIERIFANGFDTPRVVSGGAEHRH